MEGLGPLEAFAIALVVAVVVGELIRRCVEQ